MPRLRDLLFGNTSGGRNESSEPRSPRRDCSQGRDVSKTEKKQKRHSTRRTSTNATSDEDFAGGFLDYQRNNLNTPSTAAPSTDPSFVNLTASSFVQPSTPDPSPLLFRDHDRIHAPPPLFDSADLKLTDEDFRKADRVPERSSRERRLSPAVSPLGPGRVTPPTPPASYPEPQYGARPWGYGHNPSHLYIPPEQQQTPQLHPQYEVPSNLERPRGLWERPRGYWNGPGQRPNIRPHPGVHHAHRPPHPAYGHGHYRPPHPNYGWPDPHDLYGPNDNEPAEIAYGPTPSPNYPPTPTPPQQPAASPQQPPAGAVMIDKALVCRLGMKLLDKVQTSLAKVEATTATATDGCNKPRPPPSTGGGYDMPRHMSSLDLGQCGKGVADRDFIEEVIRVEMLPEQRILYDLLSTIAQRQALLAARQDALAPDMGSLTKALSNLRLAANSTDLLDIDLRSELRLLAQRYMSQLRVNDVDSNLLGRIQRINATSKEDECSICLCGPTEVVTECGHTFHRDCLFDWLGAKHSDCPMCRRPIESDKLKTNNRAFQVLDNAFTATTLLRLDGDVIQEVSSNKVTMVFKEIAKIHEQFIILRRMDPETTVPKMIVFCSIKPMLVALSHLAAAIGLGHFWLVAGADATVTNREIQMFRNSRKTSVLLAMPRASSTKFDLSFVCAIFILDPWRRSKNDEISLGMVRRGQLPSAPKVRLVKFVSERSVEEEILKGPFVADSSLDAGASRVILA